MSAKSPPPFLSSRHVVVQQRLIPGIARRFLPSYPYHDHVPLNILAGQLALFLAQSTLQDSSSSDSDAHAHGSDSSSSSDADGGSDSDSSAPERISSVPGALSESTQRKKNLGPVQGEFYPSRRVVIVTD